MKYTTFTPTETFEAVVPLAVRDATGAVVKHRRQRCTYVKGLQYTARTPELMKLVPKWRKKKLIVIRDDAAASSVSGKGLTDKE